MGETASFVAVGLFCDSIREEVGGQSSIIGVIPDNLAVPSFPGALSRLFTYIRVNVFVDRPLPNRMVSRLVFPWDQKPEEGKSVEREFMEQEIEKARADSSKEFVTFIMRMGFVNFPIPSAGRLKLFLDVDGQVTAMAALNIVEAKK